uniref:Mechanosensitive ion channel MscS domain-containing protein n=1 Tax=Cannabis sativa TaxID=3483 RepID=A0A803NFT6_CANSA
MEVREKSLKPDNNGESIVVDIPSVEPKGAKGSSSKVSELPKKASFMNSPEIPGFRPPPATPASPKIKPESILEAEGAKGSFSKVSELPEKASFMDWPEISGFRPSPNKSPTTPSSPEIKPDNNGESFVINVEQAPQETLTRRETLKVVEEEHTSPSLDDFEEIYKKVELKKVKSKKLKTKVLVEWVLFVILVSCLVCSLTIKKLEKTIIWGLELWRWIQESIFHQYVFQTLSGPPLIEEAQRVRRSPSMGRQSSFTSTKKGDMDEETQVIDMPQLYKMKQEKVSAWSMKALINVVSSSGLSSISYPLDEMENVGKEHDKEITNEMEATAAAYHIFRNVARPGSKYIDEDDLMRFMIREEVDLVLPMIGTENGRIDRKALTDWVVKIYNGRKSLGHTLTDTKTAVSQVDKLVTVILVVVTIVVWLILIKIDTTKVLVFFSSQIVVAVLVFGKDIVFVFIRHPFDVGDRCVIDGVTLVVEEMNILTTVFLKLNNEKVFYPNSVLSTKPINNYYRSPDMGDSVEFSIDFNTSLEKIAQLKQKIKKYIEKTPSHWGPTHSVVVLDIEDVNKLKMALNVTHTMNFQDFNEKNRRRSELVIEIKQIFEELGIKCCVQPETVRVNPIGLDSNVVEHENCVVN